MGSEARRCQNRSMKSLHSLSESRCSNAQRSCGAMMFKASSVSQYRYIAGRYASVFDSVECFLHLLHSTEFCVDGAEHSMSRIHSGGSVALSSTSRWAAASALSYCPAPSSTTARRPRVSATGGKPMHLRSRPALPLLWNRAECISVFLKAAPKESTA
jgi:hypothetical protein